MAAIVLIAAAAIVTGVGNATKLHWLTAIGFGLFAVGAGAFLRWRVAQRGKVLDREEKTPPEE